MSLKYIIVLLFLQFLQGESRGAGVRDEADLIQGIVPLETEKLTLNYVIESDTITFILNAVTKGWVGFGFTSGTGMESADIFMGGVMPNGQLYGKDRHSTSTGLPDEDAEQNYVLLHGSESDAGTLLIVKRLLDTGDATEDLAIGNKTMEIVWAFGDLDELEWHNLINRGQISFNFFDPTAPPEESSDPTTPITTTVRPPDGQLPPAKSLPGKIPFKSTDVEAEYSITGDIITFQVTVKGTGYVGFGFINTHIPKTTEADFFYAGVYDNGTTYVGDFVSLIIDEEPRTPIPDTIINWGLLESEEGGGYTRALFSRRLVTTDPFGHDIPIEDEEMVVCWSKGNGDSFEYHGEANREQMRFNLIQEFKKFEDDKGEGGEENLGNVTTSSSFLIFSIISILFVITFRT